MMNEFDKRRLRFIVTPTRFFDPALRSEVDKAYVCWKDVWGKTFHDELNVKDHLYSDNFTRQSLLASIFIGDVPLALCTLNRFDLSLQQDLDDSYFKVWPAEVMEELKAEMKIVMNCCNATVNYDYRKSRLGLNSIDLLFAMIVLYMKSTDAEGILGTARIEKKVPEACQRTNASFMARNVPYSIPGRFVDLVCWKRDLSLEDWAPEIKDATTYLWENKTEIYHLEKGDKHAA